jgi:hypothetical protein
MSDDDKDDQHKVFQRYFEIGLKIGGRKGSPIKVGATNKFTPLKQTRGHWSLEAFVFASLTFLCALALWHFNENTSAVAWAVTAAAAATSILRLNSARFPAKL